jgi:hypothetical protein
MIQVSKDEIDRLKSELKGQLLTPSAEKCVRPSVASLHFCC